MNLEVYSTTNYWSYVLTKLTSPSNVEDWVTHISVRNNIYNQLLFAVLMPRLIFYCKPVNVA